MSEILKRATKTLNSNLWSLMSIYLIFSIVVYLLSKIPIIGILLATLPSFILIKILLKSIRGEYMSFSDLLNLEIKNYLKFLGFTLSSMILIVIPLLIILALFFFLSLFLSFNLSSIEYLLFEESVIGSWVIVILLVLIIPLLFMLYSLLFGFTAYTCVDEDFSNLNFLDTIEYSFRILKGCRLKYILIFIISALSFIIVTPLTLGLGLLYLLPLITLAFISLYEYGKEINNLTRPKVSFLDISDFQINGNLDDVSNKNYTFEENSLNEDF